MTADEILSKLKLNKTKQRLDITNCVLHQTSPFSIHDLSKELSQYNKSTIYRFITILEENNFIEKLPLPGANGICYNLKKHSHYFVCKKCKKSIPISFCPVEAIKQAMPKDIGFTITDHNIEIFGYCDACKEK